MKARRPPHLDVFDVLGRRVEAHLERDSLQRGFGLHDRDRVGEVPDVVGLARAILGRNHPETRASRQLFGGRNPHRTVEMRVQLGLLPAEKPGRYVSA
jgi:hypothetical protein